MATSSSYFADYRAITASGLFDVEFYKSQALGIEAENVDPIVHYLTEGARLGLEPNAGFDSRYYLEQCRRFGEYPEVPLAHYIRVGANQGLSPLPPSLRQGESGDATAEARATETDGLLGDNDIQLLAAAFEPEAYARKYAASVAGLSPPELFEHYLRAVRDHPVDPSAEFNERAYLAANSDVAEQVRRGVFYCGFHHYLAFGKEEGRLPLDLYEHQRTVIAESFDAEYYLRQAPELTDYVADPILHYLQFGWLEGRDPSPTFSTGFYLESNHDVRQSGINPFVHFVEWGMAEGRPGAPVSPAVAPADARATAVVDEMEAVRAFFDEAFYRERYRDQTGGAHDLLAHYMQQGWRELKDPSPEFSTSYYLGSNPDIRDAGLNPFLHYVRHGKREGRKPLPFREWVLARPYRPRVTAIVPNYNHAAFLRTRLDSILKQTYDNLEIIILDDASTDDSLKIINAYKRAHPKKIRTLINDKNSGSVFSQWKRGVENASGELIWICESDDFCSETFLEHCVKPLADDSVMISFGRIQFADSKGLPTPGLDSYRDQAEPDIWSAPIARPASQWFRGAFAVSNLIPNVGGCVFRAQPIGEDVWTEALSYKICGDWFLYCALAHGGQIAYAPEAVAYFRQHSGNTSVSGFLKRHYYAEHEAISLAIRRRWGAPDTVIVRAYEMLKRTYRHAKAAPKVGGLEELFRLDRVLAQKRRSPHVLICFLGFQLGGGELFAIHLANALLAQGLTVSMLKLNSENENVNVKAMLDRRIAVYDAEYAIEMGLETFLANAEVDLIHSHNVGIEFLFFKRRRMEAPIPYIVSLHGSYEVTPIPEDFLLRTLRAVSHWVYLAPKNLGHLKGIPIAPDRISFIANGMPADPRPFPFSRAGLKIEKGAIVFTLASRAIPEKGWRIAVRALGMAQRNSQKPLHLILCGSGPDAERFEAEFAGDKRIHVMGFQERINGAYAISDVAILPTRFGGESYPLSLIQAMQEGRPVIATDIGQIRNMLVKDGLCAGVLVDHDEDDARFARAVAKAMVKMCDDAFRRARAADALKLGSEHDMAKVASKYVEIYQQYLPAQLRTDASQRAFSAKPADLGVAPRQSAKTKSARLRRLA